MRPSGGECSLAPPHAYQHLSPDTWIELAKLQRHYHIHHEQQISRQTAATSCLAMLCRGRSLRRCTCLLLLLLPLLLAGQFGFVATGEAESQNQHQQQQQQQQQQQVRRQPVRGGPIRVVEATELAAESAEWQEREQEKVTPNSLVQPRGPSSGSRISRSIRSGTLLTSQAGRRHKRRSSNSSANDSSSFSSSNSELLQSPQMQQIRQASESNVFADLESKLSDANFDYEAAFSPEQLGEAIERCSESHGLLRHVQTFAYRHTAADLCSSSGDLLLLVAVHSNAKNSDRRDIIRRTWGSLRFVGPHRVQVAFFLGRPAPDHADSMTGATGDQQDELIDAESKRYRDIVQLNFVENYRNMTLKHLSVYEWIMLHCRDAHYLVKVDDDTFTNVPHLAAFLSRQPQMSGFYCSATRGARPQRSHRGPNGKWAVSRREFPGQRYPTYCEGYGYALAVHHVTTIYLCSLFKPQLWIDDVYVTGVLAAATKVKREEFWPGHSFAKLVPSHASEVIMDYLFLTADRSQVFPGTYHRLWRAALAYSLETAL